MQLLNKNIAESVHPEQLVFKIACNQVVNRHLKKACTKAGIKKKITFHCSRHTFATIAITKGIGIETVQKLLGHRELKQTSIYAKIVDTRVIQEMNKLNLAINNGLATTATT